jgi:signal transduction histidine kinase
LVEALLDFARSGAQPDPNASASVGGVMRGLYEEIQPTAAAAQVQLLVEPVPSCRVACAPGVLASVLQNLIRNAVKYMGDGPVRSITTRVRFEGGVARFEVQDTGPGLPPGRREKLFEPYVRAAAPGQPGLGLGLATVKRLVESHGGQVGVISGEGQGATFWFELPGILGAEEDSLPALRGRRLSQEAALSLS